MTDSKDDARSASRVVVGGILGAAGLVLGVVAVMWFATERGTPSPPLPSAVVYMDEHAGEAPKQSPRSEGASSGGRSPPSRCVSISTPLNNISRDPSPS